MCIRDSIIPDRSTVLDFSPDGATFRVRSTFRTCYVSGCQCIVVILSGVLMLLGVQTLDVGQALFMPVGASLSLLIMFLFFDSLQLMFAVCTASKFVCSAVTDVHQYSAHR